MKSHHLVLFLLAFAVPLAARVIPTPQFVEAKPGAVLLNTSVPTQIVIANGATRQVSLAAEMIRKEMSTLRFSTVPQRSGQGPAIFLWDRLRQGSPPFPIERESDAVLDKDRYFGQSYVLETRGDNEIWIIGSSGQGVLNGAATLVQLVEASGTVLRVAGTLIRDYPSFRYRAASDWLLRAELNRWAYDWGDGVDAYVARIQRKLDFCARFKINMVLFDGFGWSSERRPGYSAMMRELNAYARERGIKLMFAGYGANFNPDAIEPEFHIGKAHVNRRSYPDGEIYSCFGEDRSKLHPTYGTCRSNDELQRRIAEEIQSFVRAVEPGALYIHHEDTGHYETTQWRWDARCEECKRRWPNPDFAATDGGAGAMAHGYANIFQAVQQVKNSDSGYSGARDCTVAFISPPYGVDSQRSGLGSVKVDPELNWRKTLEFWGNAVAKMPAGENLEIGLREIFPSSAGQQWMDAWTESMDARSLQAKVFLFFLGGADQYSRGVFNYPFTGNSVMNGMFDGAEAIYNFNGGLHQEPQQLINAEYSWNSNAPGRTTPSTFEGGLQRWNALMANQEMPPAVFGKGGVFPEACKRIYGEKAGAKMAQFFSYFEERESAGDRPLPNFYPNRIYPYIVLWRFLQGDAPFSDLTASTVEQQAVEDLQVTRPDLQQSLSQLWRQTASVNRKTKKLVAQALEQPELRSDAREDVVYLQKCLNVGERFAQLLGGYHELLATRSSERSAQLKEVMEEHRLLNEWLHREFQFDFPDPKGGDQAAWLEAMEMLRVRLQEMGAQ